MKDGPQRENMRVMVVAHDPLARAGLAGLLVEVSGLEILHAGTGDGPFRELDGRQADVVLWDLGAGPDTPIDLNSNHLNLPVVALLSDDAHVEQAWTAGARGLLLRSTDPDRIVQALAAVECGLVVVDPDLAEAVLVFREAPAMEEPTQRDREVLGLLAEGLPNKLIADRLFISENTIKFHVSAIMNKLGAHSRTEAVTRAARRRMLII